MSRTRVGTAFAALILALTLLPALQAAPAQADHGHSTGVDRLDLPDGWRPEGITTDRKHLYVGSLADGAIWRADPRTGRGEVLSPGVTGRVAVGVDHDDRRDLLWVAGGATAEVRAHDADTGEVVATYAFPSANPRFLNDVAVTRHAVYVTDSLAAELMVVPLWRGRHLPPASAATTLPLTGDLVMQEGNNLNGIVGSGHALLAVQGNAGKLFRIDPRTGETAAVDLGDAVLTNGDGLEPGKGVLYVVRNRSNLIAVLDLDRRLERGEVVDEITDPGFDVPTTAALVRDSLFAVNARFGTTPAPDTDYWITRVDAD